VILLISASQVARITGVSHWCLPLILLFLLYLIVIFYKEGYLLPAFLSFFFLVVGLGFELSYEICNCKAVALPLEPYLQSILVCLFLFIYILVLLGLELWASHLLGRHYTVWASLPALFHVGYFQDRVLRTICPAGFEPRSSQSQLPK
jgi:Trk-type K+ transport system membrane component